MQKIDNATTSCLKHKFLYIRFNTRNIPLKFNPNRSFDTLYAYSAFYKNYNLGIVNSGIKEKVFYIFNFTLFVYDKKDGVFYGSIEGNTRKKNKSIKYLFLSNNEKKEYQKYKFTSLEKVAWPLFHKIKIKNVISKEIVEIDIEISNKNK